MKGEEFKKVQLDNVTVPKWADDGFNKMKKELAFDSVGECIEYIARRYFEKHTTYLQ